MKMTAPAAVLAACLSLAACAPQDAAAIVDNTQNTAIKVCAFVPTATTILNLFQVVGPAATAADVATIICNAVVKKGSAEWVYNGVTITGRFVR